MTTQQIKSMIQSEEFPSHDHSGGDGGQIAYSSLSGAPVFARTLTSDLTFADGQCLVIAGYIDLATFDLNLDGDSDLEIL